MNVINAKVIIAKNIKVAEMAKVIENTQRDINIALMNEVSIICHRLKIPTDAVIKAASSKWNFIKFDPGLVGGHCIGVDPYYLKYKCEQINYNPKIISAGRKINDSMPDYIFKKIKLISKKIKTCFNPIKNYNYETSTSFSSKKL